MLLGVINDVPAFFLFVLKGVADAEQSNIKSTVDFSTYPDGLMTSYPDWTVSGTSGSRLEWKTEGGRSCVSTSEYAKAFYAPIMYPSCSRCNVIAQFQMKITGLLSAGYADVMYVGLANPDNRHDDTVNLALRRDPGSQCRLIYSTVQSGVLAASGSLGTFSLADIDPDGDGYTDELSISLTIVRGSTKKDWRLIGAISNRTAGVQIRSGEATFASNDACFTGNLISMMGTGAGDTAASVEARAVNRFSISAVPEPYKAFYHKEQFSIYENGRLAANSDWLITSGSTESRYEWLVSGSECYTPTSDYSQVFYTAAAISPAYSTYRAGIHFQMKIDGNLSANSADPFFVGFADKSNKYDNAVSVNLRRDAGTQWRLVYSIAQSGVTNVSGTLATFDQADLDPANNGTTDTLALKMSITRDKLNTNQWQLSATLHDLKTSNLIQHGKAEFSTAKDFLAHGILPFMGVGASDAMALVETRRISEMTITALPDALRVLYNNDLTNIMGCESPYHEYGAEFTIDMLRASVDETVEAGCDAHLLAPLLTYVPAWKSNIYPIGEHVAWLTSQFPNHVISDYIRCLSEGTDIVSVFIDHCRSKGIAPFLAVRMNDWHTLEWIGADSDTRIDRFTPCGLDKWRWDHPEYRISDPADQAAVEATLTDDRAADFRKNPALAGTLREQRVLDWRFGAVRERMFGFLQEICTGYDIEGLELDFMRHMKIFNLDLTTNAEREEIMTAFISRVRRLLNDTAKPGRYRYLSLRVPSYASAFDAYGFNLEKLYALGVDMLTLSCNYYTVQQLGTENIHRQAPQIRLYPELTYTEAGRLVDGVSIIRRADPEHFQTAAHIGYSLGASGVNFFNFQYYRRSGSTLDGWCEPPFDVIQSLKDSLTLGKRPQYYFLCGGWNSFIGYANAVEPRIALLIPGAWVEGQARSYKPDLLPPIDGWKGSGRLRIQSWDAYSNQVISVKINGTTLSSTTDISESYTPISTSLHGDATNLKAWTVPESVLVVGENEITIKLESGGSLKAFFIDLSL